MIGGPDGERDRRHGFERRHPRGGEADVGGEIGGALVIRPDGIDFRLLEPLSLAVLMFIGLPGVYGVVTSVLAERFLERSAFFRDSALSFAGPALLLPFALLGGVGILVVGSVGLVLVLSLAGPRLAWIRSSRLVTWLGRAGLASVGMVASIALIRDVTEVL